MYMMWYVVVMAALFYVTVALPFGLFYSETDEEKEFVSVNDQFSLQSFILITLLIWQKWRICSAFKNQVILLVILAAIVFPMYALMNYSYFPITMNRCQVSDFMAANVVVDKEYISTCVATEQEVEVRVGF